MSTEKPTTWEKPTTEAKPTTGGKRSKRKIVIGGVVLLVLALALGLGLGLGLKHKSNAPSNTPEEFTESWNDPSQFLLSKNFTITKTPTTRVYNWTLTQSTISPDGLARPMLLVNGRKKSEGKVG